MHIICITCMCLQIIQVIFPLICSLVLSNWSHAYVSECMRTVHGLHGSTHMSRFYEAIAVHSEIQIDSPNIPMTAELSISPFLLWLALFISIFSSITPCSWPAPLFSHLLSTKCTFHGTNLGFHLEQCFHFHYTKLQKPILSRFLFLFLLLTYNFMLLFWLHTT